MSYIVLDENDNKVYEGPEKRGHGYERRADGNFYKKHGDPRCLFEKYIEEIRKEKESKFERKSDPRITAPPKDKSAPPSTKEYYAMDAIPVEKLERSIFSQSKLISDETIICKGARLMYPVGCEILLTGYMYSKIIIDKFASTVSIWNFQNNTDTPDLVIKGLI